MKKKENRKIIPLKNYFYSIIILIGIVLLTLYIFSWYKVKKEERLMNSYLLTSKTIESKIDSLEVLEQSLSEAPSSYFVLITYREDENTYNLEKNLKRIIDRYKLNDLFYYVDVTNNKDNEDYKNKLNKIFKVDNINNYPVILYIEDGKTKEVLNDLKIDDFKKCLETYKYEVVK